MFGSSWHFLSVTAHRPRRNSHPSVPGGWSRILRRVTSRHFPPRHPRGSGSHGALKAPRQRPRPCPAMSSSLPGSRDLPISQYDLGTYMGRVRHSIGITDPRCVGPWRREGVLLWPLPPLQPRSRVRRRATTSEERMLTVDWLQYASRRHLWTRACQEARHRLQDGEAGAHDAGAMAGEKDCRLDAASRYVWAVASPIPRRNANHDP